MNFKAIEVSVNLSKPTATTAAIEAAATALPGGSKFLGSSATPSSVFLFFDVPGYPAPPPKQK
jgi:hypothetical protein